MVESVDYFRLLLLFILHFPGVGGGVLVRVQLSYLVHELALSVNGLALGSGQFVVDLP